MTGAESPVVDVLLSLAAVATALTVLWRFLGIGTFLHRTRAFLDDWQGEPARPGYKGRPSVPERLDAVETRTATLLRNSGSSMRDAVDDVQRRVVDLQARAQSNRDGIDELQHRVTDHRRRNEQQVEALRAAVEARLAAIEARSTLRRHTDHDHPQE